MRKTLLTVATALALTAGCEHSSYSDRFAAHEGDGGAKNTNVAPKNNTVAASNDFIVGTWKLTSTEDGSSWYAFFNKDYSWRIADNADGSAMRVYGTYTVSGNNASGDMTNPRVGTGNIYAKVEGGVMTFDFEEHWHTPHKTIRYTGQKQ